MRKCKACGQVTSDTETFCPRCGSGQLTSDGKAVKREAVNIAQHNAIQKASHKESRSTIVNTEVSNDATVGDFLKLNLIALIPIIGVFIYLFRLISLAKGRTNKVSLQNYAKSVLIMLLVIVVICTLALLINFALKNI